MILRGNKQLWTLLHLKFKKHIKAEHGGHGSSNLKTGSQGKDVFIDVPLGTIVRDEDTDDILFEITDEGEEKILQKGGRGGLGNNQFKSPTNQTPRHAQPGEEGAEGWKVLELKILADVGLVGFPNAGKSTFISSVSAAKPKIANYPFTTLEPHLGVVRMGGSSEFIIADIPGIIEGASEGRGLGHQFLRHIERARVLCVLVDLAPMDEVSADEQERILLQELQAYQPELLERPRIVVGTKTDAATEEVMLAWKGQRMSAVTGDGVRPILGALAELVQRARTLVPSQESSVVIRPEPEGTHIERMGDNEFRLIGRDVERSVALSDVSTPDALNYIDERLKRLGVARLLSRAGASDGAVVHIGAFSFEYTPET